MLRISLILLAATSLVACDNSGTLEQDPITGKPLPEWWNSISAPILTTDAERRTLWQAKPRCCIDKSDLTDNRREFFKACTQAIYDHRSNETLVVNCLWLMENRDQKGDRKTRYQYIVDNYYYHNKDLGKCANCMQGNTVARVSARLARIYYSSGDYPGAIELIENVIRDRGREISPWVLIELYTQLGNYYHDHNPTDEQIDRIQAVWEVFDAKRNDETIERRIKAFDKVHRKLSEQHTLTDAIR